MATQVKRRRGTNAEVLAGVPAIAEVWVNTTDTTMHLGDGVTLGGVKHINENTLTNYTDLAFDSVSDLITTNLPLLGKKVRTLRYNAHVVQYWEVMEAIPVGEYGIAINGGLFAVEVSDVKYPESFGAYADGVTLDDDAFQFARSYDGKVEGLGDYLISQFHPLSNNTQWFGNWSKISAQGSNQLFTFSSGTRFGEFELDGLSGAHTAYPTQIVSPSDNVVLGDIVYRNFSGVVANFQTYPLNIPLYGASNFKIGNLEFYNITQEDDGIITGPGFVGGIYLVGLDAEVPNGKSYGVVGDVYADTIKSIDTGSGVIQDSDLIRFFAETTSTEDFDIQFGNVTGRNVYKRIVKGASISGVRFGDVKSFNPEDGVEVYTLFSAVEVLGTGRNFQFGDVSSHGPSERTVWFKGSGNKCGDIYSDSTIFSMIFGGSLGDLAQSCQCGDLMGRGDEGSVSGTGVYFFNADDCEAGNVAGLYDKSVLTFEDNTGKNTVGDVTGSGSIAILHGNTIVGNMNLDYTTRAGGISTPVQLGERFTLSNTDITTDGRVTVSVGGVNVDGDLGVFKVKRVSAANGIESSHSVFTTGSASGGLLRGVLDIEVNNTVSGTPSGSSGRTLAYFAGLNIERLDLSINVTASVRGATGFHYWLNGVDGQANRIAVKSLLSAVGSQASGKLGITKIEHLVPGSASLTLSGEVNVFLIERDATTAITGVNNTPVTVNSTR